jgi:hypothetical protein
MAVQVGQAGNGDAGALVARLRKNADFDVRDAAGGMLDAHIVRPTGGKKRSLKPESFHRGDPAGSVRPAAILRSFA